MILDMMSDIRDNQLGGLAPMGRIRVGIYEIWLWHAGHGTGTYGILLRGGEATSPPRHGAVTDGDTRLLSLTPQRTTCAT